MNTILLFIICILLVGDLFFLRKMYKNGVTGSQVFADEKYFELKYNINLLKSISAILIFVVTFLGYSSYKDFKSEITGDLNSSTEKQRNEIDKLTMKTDSIKNILRTLEILRHNLQENISNYGGNMEKLNNKVISINSTLKYNPRIYVVNDLKYLVSYYDLDQPVKIYFKDLVTSFNEKLPIFNKPPLINLEGHSINISIIKITNEYFEIISGSTTLEGENDKNEARGYYTFDIWLASYN